MRARINMRGSGITGRTTQDFITEARNGDDDLDAPTENCITECDIRINFDTNE